MGQIVKYRIHIAGPVKDGEPQCCARCGETLGESPVNTLETLVEGVRVGRRIGVKSPHRIYTIPEGGELETDEEECGK